MKNQLKLLLKFALILIVLSAVNLYARDKIRIHLSQPPPGQMGVGDLWNLELTNITKENVKIYLKGTATEEKDGLIIEGTSKMFTIKPGTTKYKYSDFSNAEVKYNNGKYKEIIIRTGNAPDGNYTLCVTAFEETGDIAGQENCIIQSVKQLGSISLISPEDGAEINPEQPIIFNWTPLPKGGPYTLRIVELKGSQSPDDAFRSNKPIFEKELRTTTYQGDPIHGIDVKLGMKYAWQVSSGEVMSEILTLKVKTDNKFEFLIYPHSNDTIKSENLDIIVNKKLKKFDMLAVKLLDNNNRKSLFSSEKSMDSIISIPGFYRNTTNILTLQVTGYQNGIAIGTQEVTLFKPRVCFDFKVLGAGEVTLGLYTGPDVMNLSNEYLPETDWIFPTIIYLQSYTLIIPSYLVPVNPTNLTLTLQDAGYPPHFYPCDPPPGCDYSAYFENIRCENYHNNSVPIYQLNNILPGNPINASNLFQNCISGKQYLLKLFDNNNPVAIKTYLIVTYY